MKKVKLKTKKQLKKFAKYMGGETSETLYYIIDLKSGKPVESEPKEDGAYVAKAFNAVNHGEEFLVVDHPNPISRQEYDLIKELFEEQEKSEDVSYNGVF